MTLPEPLAGHIEALRQRPITGTEKGFGPLAARQQVSAASLAAQRPPLHDAGLSYPLLTLRESALTHNVDAMAAYCRAAGVGLAPHGKTTMAPQLAARQLAAGAWGITVATVGQLQTYRTFGVSRLLLANELVDPAGIAWLAGQLNADPGLEVLCYVDSTDGVAHLDRHLRRHTLERPLAVLVELGHHPHGRTGARTQEEALAVAAAATRTSTLAVAGVAGYEGGLGHHADPATLERVAAYCRALRALTDALHEAGLTGDRPVLTAGGSAFFDVVVAELTAATRPELHPQVILRSGCYVTHDHGFYADISPAARDTAGGLTLRPAFELWAPVLSRPEPGLALLGAGRRDVSFDARLPVPLRVRAQQAGAGRGEDVAAMSVTALNDQHAYLNVPENSGLRPGDLVSLGISHPCTTFDKWRVIPVVDDSEQVTDVIHTFF